MQTQPPSEAREVSTEGKISGAGRSASVACLICQGNSSLLFSSRVLQKYDVGYFKCAQCEFIQTEQPYWLEEAYSTPITSMDVGLVQRNLTSSKLTEQMIRIAFDPKARFLDYAGGYGLFVRLMRDKGYNFYRQDRYCQNLFAGNHDVTDLPPSSKFELVTAFEVFEHFSDPWAELRGIFEFSDSVLFSTEICPSSDLKGAEDWWYFGEELGQHISFFSLKSLQVMAQKSQCELWTNGQGMHLFTRRKLKANPFRVESSSPLYGVFQKALRYVGRNRSPRMESLIQSDFELARKKARG
jgi:hypothetical protein